MEIKRDKYLTALIDRIGNNLIKIITGLRRSGKSYLLNTIFYNYLINERKVDKDHVIKFAFDYGDDLAVIGEDLIELEEHNKKVDAYKFIEYIKRKITDDKTYYLLLDEIQNLQSFELVLNGFLGKKNLDIFVTGSNSKFLSSDIITEFEGRGDEIHVFPLSFKEFYSAYEGNKYDAFDEYCLYGGLPLLCSMNSHEQKAKYLTQQIDRIYLNDIIKHNNLYSNSDISELFDVLASEIGCLVNTSKLSDTFKSVKKKTIARETLDKYVYYFEDAFLISKALRYDIKGKKYIETPYKIYFEDIGIRNAKLNFRQVEPTHIMENIIYNELRLRGFNVDVGVVDVFEKDENNSISKKRLEIDFIATLGSKKYYIQSAYDLYDYEKFLKEIRPFKAIDDSFKKIVILKNPAIPRQNDDGYLILGIQSFLLNDNSLEF